MKVGDVIFWRFVAHVREPWNLSEVALIEEPIIGLRSLQGAFVTTFDGVKSLENPIYVTSDDIVIHYKKDQGK